MKTITIEKWVKKFPGRYMRTMYTAMGPHKSASVR